MPPSLDQYILIGLSFVYLYFLIKQFFYHKNFKILQETSIALVFGTMFGAFIYFYTDVFDSNNHLNFNRMGKYARLYFWCFCHPCFLRTDIMCLKESSFKISFMSTFMDSLVQSSTFLSLPVQYGFSMPIVKLISSVSDHTQSINLQNWQILLFAICLCSIDVVVPQKIISPERHPKMFSIIFGESILKDTITVTMFDAIVSTYQKLGVNGLDITSDFIGQLILDFFETSTLSILIGIVTALFTTFLFKCCRFLMVDEGVSQIALIIITGYSGYVISEMFDFSGVISMLFCGLVLSHYNIYNMTEKGKQSTKQLLKSSIYRVVITMMKVITEGLLFFVLGAFVFNIQDYTIQEGTAESSAFSLVLFGIGIGGLLIGRFLNIYAVSVLGYLIKGKQKWRLNRHQLAIVYMSGLIKGAVPFGLILIIPNNNTPASNCVQTSIVFIVYLTTLLVNPLLPGLIKWQLRKRIKLQKEDPTHPSMRDSLLLNDKAEIQKHFRQLNQDITRLSFGNHPIHHHIATFNSQNTKKPNFIKKLSKRSARHWNKFQEGVLKPIFIHNYFYRRDQIKLEKLKQRRDEYLDYLQKFEGFNKENLLSAENEDINKFIEVVIESDNSKSSYDSQRGIYRIKRRSEMPKLLNHQLSEWTKGKPNGKGKSERHRHKSQFGGVTDNQNSKDDDDLLSSKSPSPMNSLSRIKEKQPENKRKQTIVASAVAADLFKQNNYSFESRENWTEVINSNNHYQCRRQNQQAQDNGNIDRDRCRGSARIGADHADDNHHIQGNNSNKQKSSSLLQLDKMKDNAAI